MSTAEYCELIRAHSEITLWYHTLRSYSKITPWNHTKESHYEPHSEITLLNHTLTSHSKVTLQNHTMKSHYEITLRNHTMNHTRKSHYYITLLISFSPVVLFEKLDCAHCICLQLQIIAPSHCLGQCLFSILWGQGVLSLAGIPLRAALTVLLVRTAFPILALSSRKE